MIYREPKNLIVQVEDNLLGQVQYYWTYYGKPCEFLQISGKTQGLTAILLKMNNPDTGSFVFILCERLKARMYEQGTKKPLTVEEVFMY